MHIEYDAEPLHCFMRAIADRVSNGHDAQGKQSVVQAPTKRGRSHDAFEDSDGEEEVMMTVPVTTSRTITTADRVAATLRNPFRCELLSKSTAKGFFESRYADVSLASLGCVPIFEDRIPTTKQMKTVIGKQCVFLRLGTTLVISGVIIEVMEKMCQVSPDRGQNVGVEWVEAARVFSVPEDLQEVRRQAREQIVSLLSNSAKSES